MFSLRPTSTPRPRGFLCDPCGKNHLSCFSICSLRSLGVEDPLWRTVKFFVNVCLYFVCSHRLRRGPCGKNHLSCFSICSLRSLGVEDPPRRTVKFFVIVCLYFVCRRFAAENSHRLRRASVVKSFLYF